MAPKQTAQHHHLTDGSIVTTYQLKERGRGKTPGRVTYGVRVCRDGEEVCKETFWDAVSQQRFAGLLISGMGIEQAKATVTGMTVQAG